MHFIPRMFLNRLYFVPVGPSTHSQFLFKIVYVIFEFLFSLGHLAAVLHIPGIVLMHLLPPCGQSVQRKSLFLCDSSAFSQSSLSWAFQRPCAYRLLTRFAPPLELFTIGKASQIYNRCLRVFLYRNKFVGALSARPFFDKLILNGSSIHKFI